MKSYFKWAVVISLFSWISISESSSDGSCTEGYYCHGLNALCYSFGFRATCVNDRCRCPNDPTRDACTCFSIIGGCHIQRNANNPVATAGSSTTYSCVANDNCDNEVHILGSYESAQGTFRTHPTGYPNVYLTVTGSSSRPLVLVLSSYEHTQWNLHIPSGVVIAKVVISSFLNSSVIYPPGRVLAVENNLRLSGYGNDGGGGRTHQLLTSIYNRFGRIASFTGTYNAAEWRLTINRRNPNPGCISAPSVVSTATTPTTAISTQAPPTRAVSTQATTSTTGVVVGSCHLRSATGNAVATARYRGSPPRNGYTTYSCVANDNCDNEVHVLGSYESTQRGFRQHPTGQPDVYLTVTGSSSRPLILVLSSYEPAQWTLNIPSGVVISKVIISSYYTNTVRTSGGGRVLSVEDSLDYIAYGSDDGGGDTHGLLLHLYERFGPVSSFTGTYQADEWRLTINRGDPDPNCLSAPFQVPTPTIPFSIPNFNDMPNSVQALSSVEIQCISDTVTQSILNNCLSGDVELICRNVNCFERWDQIFTQCGRNDFLETGCGSAPSSTLSKPHIAAISLGVGIPLVVILLAVLCLFCIAKAKPKSRSTRSSSATRAAAVVNSHRPPEHHYAMTQPAVATFPGAKLPEGVLSTAEPPSYASVIADDGRYFTVLHPPPYPGINPKETET